MTRKIAPIDINGKLVLIEVDDTIEIIPPESQEKGVEDDFDGYDMVSADDPNYFEKLKDKVADMSDLVSSVVGSIDKGMEATKPDEWSVEFTIGYKAEKELKIPFPFISGKGEVNGGIKITAKWKKD